MTASLQNAKAALREKIRARLAALSDHHRAHASRECCARLSQQRVWSQARVILFFGSLPGEPDLWPLLREALAAGKVVALPRFVSRAQGYGAAAVRDVQSDLVRRQLNILEPSAACPEISPHAMDLILVPGVAFDARGGRLGKGKGYYDRLLAGVRAVKCGVAFDEQFVASVPVGPQDVRLDCLVTPTRWVEVGKS